MSRLEKLRQKVIELYREKNADRADWADWIYQNHVSKVADQAKILAERFGGDVELSQVAALLHDIADIQMKRSSPEHESESLKIARNVMSDFGYSDSDIDCVVDDAIRFHSCNGQERPKSQEGLVLATADALAHLTTDFYSFATWDYANKGEGLEEIKKWVLKKIDRDFYNKIAFEQIRGEVKSNYEVIKVLFGDNKAN